MFEKRMFSCVKRAEYSFCNLIHILVHIIDVIRDQCLYKVIVSDSFTAFIKLTDYDLFIHCRYKRLVIQQILHCNLYIRSSLHDQSPDQAVGTGICPISGKFPVVEIFGDGTGVINISLIREA